MTNSESDSINELQRTVRILDSRSRILDAKLLAEAREIELSADYVSIGKDTDRINTAVPKDLKSFVRRNRGARFTLRICTRRDSTKPIHDALGEPGYAEAFARPTRVRLGALGGGSIRIAFFIAKGSVSAWLGVTVRFPRDPNGSAVIRDAFIILDEV